MNIDYRRVAEAADIERVAASCGIRVERGKALCPFHDDRRPSMQIYPDGYHCFVCGAHGDAIDLVQGVRRCTRKEAAELVARISGGELVELDGNALRRETERKQRQRLYDAAVDAYADTEFEIERFDDIIAEAEPFSIVWCFAQQERNRQQFRRLIADNIITDGRQKRRLYGKHGN